MVYATILDFLTSHLIVDVSFNISSLHCWEYISTPALIGFKPLSIYWYKHFVSMKHLWLKSSYHVYFRDQASSLFFVSEVFVLDCLHSFSPLFLAILLRVDLSDRVFLLFWFELSLKVVNVVVVCFFLFPFFLLF